MLGGPGRARHTEGERILQRRLQLDRPAREAETGGYSVAELNGRGVAGIGPKMSPAQAPTMWMTYLATADADATAAKIKGAGGQLVTEPTDVMDAGRMAVAVDAAGAVFGIWQAGAFPGAQIVNEPGAMVWNEQMSHDFEASKAFYAAVFGSEYGDMSTDSFLHDHQSRRARRRRDRRVSLGPSGRYPSLLEGVLRRYGP